MRFLKEIIGRRRRPPALVRWLSALLLFGIALGIRSSLGFLYGAVPFLTFYPAILLAAVLLGWQEAALVLALSVAVGWYFFLPATTPLLPLGWLFVGALNIAIIAALQTLAQELAEANERQRLLFQEVQHRIANTLQSAVIRLEIVRRRINARPAEATEMLDDAIRRMAAAATMHRRLHDPGLLMEGMGVILREVVAAIVDRTVVSQHFDIDDLDLSQTQKNVIAMLVLEVVNNAEKHVFQRHLGTRLDVSLRALPGGRAVIQVCDDGPGNDGPGNDGPGGTGDIGPGGAGERGAPDQKLGQRILQGLAAQLDGKLTTNVENGRAVAVEFPISS